MVSIIGASWAMLAVVLALSPALAVRDTFDMDNVLATSEKLLVGGDHGQVASAGGWHLDQRFWLCSPGAEQLFQGRFAVSQYESVTKTIDALNGEVLQEPAAGFLAVHSPNNLAGEAWWLLYKVGKKEDAERAIKSAGVSDWQRNQARLERPQPEGAVADVPRPEAFAVEDSVEVTRAIKNAFVYETKVPIREGSDQYVSRTTRSIETVPAGRTGRITEVYTGDDARVYVQFGTQSRETEEEQSLGLQPVWACDYDKLRVVSRQERALKTIQQLKGFLQDDDRELEEERLQAPKAAKLKKQKQKESEEVNPGKALARNSLKEALKAKHDKIGLLRAAIDEFGRFVSDGDEQLKKAKERLRALQEAKAKKQKRGLTSSSELDDSLPTVGRRKPLTLRLREVMKDRRRSLFVAPRAQVWVLCEESWDAQQEGKWIKGVVTDTASTNKKGKIAPHYVEVEVHVGKKSKHRMNVIVPENLNYVKPEKKWQFSSHLAVELGQEVQMLHKDGEDGEYYNAVVDEADGEYVTVVFVDGPEGISGTTKNVKWSEWASQEAGGHVTSDATPATFLLREARKDMKPMEPRPAVLKPGEDALVLCEKPWNVQKAGTWLKGKVTNVPEGGSKVEVQLYDLLGVVAVDDKKKRKKETDQPRGDKFWVERDLSSVKPISKWRPQTDYGWELGKMVSNFHEGIGPGKKNQADYNAVIDEADGSNVTIVFIEGPQGIKGETKTLNFRSMSVADQTLALGDPNAPWTPQDDLDADSEPVSEGQTRHGSTASGSRKAGGRGRRGSSRSVPSVSSDDRVVHSGPMPSTFRVREVVGLRPAHLDKNEEAWVLCETDWNAEKAGTWLKGKVTEAPKGGKVDVQLYEPLVDDPLAAVDGEEREPQGETVSVKCDLSWVKPESKWRPDREYARDYGWELGKEVSYFHEGIGPGGKHKADYNAVIDEADGFNVTIVFIEGPNDIKGTTKTLNFRSMSDRQKITVLGDPVEPWTPPAPPTPGHGAQPQPVVPKHPVTQAEAVGPWSQQQSFLVRQGTNCKELGVQVIGSGKLSDFVSSLNANPEAEEYSRATSLGVCVIWEQARSVFLVLYRSDAEDRAYRLFRNQLVKAPPRAQFEKQVNVERVRRALAESEQRAMAAQGSELRLAVFDNDNTLTETHVFKGLASTRNDPFPKVMEVAKPRARTELGQMRRIQMYDEQMVRVGAFAEKAFGGQVRVGKIRKLLELLKAKGVVMIIITRGFVGPVKMCLRDLGLLDYFADVYGNVWYSHGYKSTKYDQEQLQVAPTPAEAELLGEEYQGSWGDKKPLISSIMQEGQLKKREVAYLEDDPDEAANAEELCSTKEVKSREGIDDSHITWVRKMCGESVGQEHKGFKVGQLCVIHGARDTSFNGKEVKLVEFLANVDDVSENVEVEMVNGGSCEEGDYDAGKKFKFPLENLDQLFDNQQYADPGQFQQVSRQTSKGSGSSGSSRDRTTSSGSLQ